MSLAKGKYGIEYNPNQMKPDSSGLGWIVVVVVIIAVISLGWTLFCRLRVAADGSDVDVTDVDAPRSAAPAVKVDPPPVPAAVPVAPVPAKSVPKVEESAPETPLPAQATGSFVKRPVKLRNLLMRLEEADKRRDVEMAVTTIEAIRALPGSPAADLDDSLARRLGALNMKRLFVLKNAQWVKTVTVKRGDSASRIASENGSTLASLAKLNGGKVDKVVLGRSLFVMNHPRFNLVVHRRPRTADLTLNGKFFKRYDLIGGVTGKEGAYEVPSRWRNFWQGELGVQLKAVDRNELESLLPVGTSVLISEM